MVLYDLIAEGNKAYPSKGYFFDPAAPNGQGLTLVDFSAQREPCLTIENTLHTPAHPLTPP